MKGEKSWKDFHRALLSGLYHRGVTQLHRDVIDASLRRVYDVVAAHVQANPAPSPALRALAARLRPDPITGLCDVYWPEGIASAFTHDAVTLTSTRTLDSWARGALPLEAQAIFEEVLDAFEDRRNR